MLPSASRLRHRSGFAAVYGRGRSYAADLIVVYVRPNRRDWTRVGFSVSKKLGKAVARNRTKRVLREATRQLLPQTASGYDVVVVARPAAAHATSVRILAALRYLFQRAGILTGARG